MNFHHEKYLSRDFDKRCISLDFYVKNRDMINQKICGVRVYSWVDMHLFFDFVCYLFGRGICIELSDLGILSILDFKNRYALDIGSLVKFQNFVMPHKDTINNFIEGIFNVHSRGFNSNRSLSDRDPCAMVINFLVLERICIRTSSDHIKADLKKTIDVMLPPARELRGVIDLPPEILDIINSYLEEIMEYIVSKKVEEISIANGSS